MTGYHDSQLPPAVNQLVVDNYLFRTFQDTFVMSVMKEEATLWSLLAGIGEGWRAILQTHRCFHFVSNHFLLETSSPALFSGAP